MNNTILKWPGSKARVMGELSTHLPAGGTVTIGWDNASGADWSAVVEVPQ